MDYERIAELARELTGLTDLLDVAGIRHPRVRLAVTKSEASALHLTYGGVWDRDLDPKSSVWRGTRLATEPDPIDPRDRLKWGAGRL